MYCALHFLSVKHDMVVDRRSILQGGSATVLAMLCGNAPARAASREQTALISRSALRTPKTQAPLEFDLFFDLSRYITARSELDKAVAREHFHHFSQEEWGWKIAGELYTQLQDALQDGVGSMPELMMGGTLSDLHQWYAQHVLDAWYEGIYRYDGAETRVTLENALMWDDVRGIVPVQGLSSEDYGYWGKKPARSGEQ